MILLVLLNCASRDDVGVDYSAEIAWSSRAYADGSADVQWVSSFGTSEIRGESNVGEVPVGLKFSASGESGDWACALRDATRCAVEAARKTHANDALAVATLGMSGSTWHFGCPSDRDVVVGVCRDGDVLSEGAPVYEERVFGPRAMENAWLVEAEVTYGGRRSRGTTRWHGLAFSRRTWELARVSALACANAEAMSVSGVATWKDPLARRALGLGQEFAGAMRTYGIPAGLDSSSAAPSEHHAFLSDQQQLSEQNGLWSCQVSRGR